MRSTFMGLETNKRGLYTQQSALYTTGHNISNANTLGYSRQRVNMESTSGFPGIGLNSGTMPGFLGTGVQSGSIQRIRDSFVDHQYRQESNKLGYWDDQTKAIAQMEDVLTEPSAHGLQKTLSQFWSSLQDVAANSNENGARTVAIRKGAAVADSFNYMHKSLTTIQTNIGSEINQSTLDINSILSQIASLNEQIQKVEPNGYIPNDLYDARDVLLDELAIHLPLAETEYVESGGAAVKGVAEGSAIVRLKLKDGTTVDLVNGNQAAKVSADFDGTSDNINKPIEGITITGLGGRVITHDELSDQGSLKSLMNSYGTSDGKGLYPDMLVELNKMAQEFAKAFNEIHMGGTDLEGELGSHFFVDDNFNPANPPTDYGNNITAGNISINLELIGNPGKFAASSSAEGDIEEGNAGNVQKLSELQFKSLTGLGGATLETYFQGVIGELGVNGMEANKLAYNSATLLGAVEHRRASISSVSLDEEMTDMIRFQQAYNASARMITVIDETLEKIINGMGIVGR